MLQYGADMDAVSLYFPGNFRDGGDMSKEAEFQFIAFLWENGIDDIISAKTKYKRTVLNDAAATIGEGADVGVKNNDGKTAYDIAAELGYDECAKVLQP